VEKAFAKLTPYVKEPRHLQFEADINRLFLYTSYNRLGRNADEADAEEIVDMASKASFADQQKQVQENIHFQVKTFCKSMDEILLPEANVSNEPPKSASQMDSAPRRSGLSFAVGKSGGPSAKPSVPDTKPMKRAELSQTLKDHIGWTLELKPSEIPNKDAGQGLFINGEADAGAVVAFYPGVTYSPAFYRYIPGYPRVDAHNPYLITRFDGTVINAQPWGIGGEARELWDGSIVAQIKADVTKDVEKGSDRIWKMLSKPLEHKQGICGAEVLERRNPLAFAHFANHPAKGMIPNVMVCPYDFPLSERDMRAYIPNISFGGEQEVKMKRFGTFWLKSWGSQNEGSNFAVLRTLVLVATRALSNEEVLLNYRLSNSKRRPSWYAPVDEEEDRRRWS
ncbi:hypothetical protein RJ641_036539, partial [Dillenia turbinata]